MDGTKLRLDGPGPSRALDPLFDAAVSPAPPCVRPFVKRTVFGTLTGRLESLYYYYKRKTAQSDFPPHLVLFGYILRIHSHKSIITLSGSSFAAAR